MKKYILITAAKNEQDYIEKTINSVINQTLLPSAWCIVSDGSIDKTDDIVKSYADQYSFIKYIRNDNTDDRNFASKVYAIKIALHFIKKIHLSTILLEFLMRILFLTKFIMKQ